MRICSQLWRRGWRNVFNKRNGVNDGCILINGNGVP